MTVDSTLKATSDHRIADVVIVGAGPAGCATAITLRQLGVDSVVMVDKSQSPDGPACGGAITPSGIRSLKKLDVWASVEPQSLWIHGMRLVTPDDQESVYSGRKTVDAVVCRRNVLDALLRKHAQDRGAELVSGFEATTFKIDGERVVGVAAKDGRVISAPLTVVAGGSTCVLGRGPEVPVSGSYALHGLMGRWEGVTHRANHIEMVFDRSLLPHYGWLFPEPEGTVNIGILFDRKRLWENKDGSDLFKRFVDKHFGGRLENAIQQGELQQRSVAQDHRLGQLTRPGMLLAGEAGRLAHPATAEGIHQALQSGIFAASTAFDVLTSRRGEPAALRAYEWRCKLAFEASFAAGKAFGELLQRTPTLDWLVTAGHHPWVQQLAGRVLDLNVGRRASRGRSREGS